jgi:hypothetical protein
VPTGQAFEEGAQAFRAESVLRFRLRVQACLRASRFWFSYAQSRSRLFAGPFSLLKLCAFRRQGLASVVPSSVTRAAQNQLAARPEHPSSSCVGSATVVVRRWRIDELSIWFAVHFEDGWATVDTLARRRPRGGLFRRSLKHLLAVSALPAALAMPSGAAPAGPALHFTIFARTGIRLTDVDWTGRQFLYVEKTINEISAAPPAGLPLRPLASLPPMSEETRCVVAAGGHARIHGCGRRGRARLDLYFEQLRNGHEFKVT